MLQPTNSACAGGESRSGKKIPRRKACRFDSGLGHQLGSRPSSAGRLFLELSSADRFGLPVACLRCRVVLQTFGSTSGCWMVRDCVDGSVANAYPPACSNRSAFRKTLRQAGALAFARQLACASSDRACPSCRRDRPDLSAVASTNQDLPLIFLLGSELFCGCY